MLLTNPDTVATSVLVRIRGAYGIIYKNVRILGKEWIRSAEWLMSEAFFLRSHFNERDCGV